MAAQQYLISFCCGLIMRSDPTHQGVCSSLKANIFRICHIYPAESPIGQKVHGRQCLVMGWNCVWLVCGSHTNHTEVIKASLATNKDLSAIYHCQKTGLLEIRRYALFLWYHLRNPLFSLIYSLNADFYSTVPWLIKQSHIFMNKVCQIG